MTRLPLALSALVLAAACSSTREREREARIEDAGADAGGLPRLVVTADWLNRSLSLLDYDALVAGALSRDAALVGTVDLSAYPPGPIEVAVTPDRRTAVVAVGPGFFAGVVGGVIGATNVETGGRALIVDLETRTVVAELPSPSPPMGVQITPDGRLAVTADHGGGQGNTVSVIDIAARSIAVSVTVARGPEETSIAPDGLLAVVNTDSDESIRFFDPRDPEGTMTAPLRIGGDPGGSTFVPDQGKLVIGKSLNLSGSDVPGYAVVDVSDATAPIVLEAAPIDDAVPYGVDLISGTNRVLATLGISSCGLREIDVSVNPSTVVRTIPFPCEKPSLPLSTSVDREGRHAFVAVPGDNSLMVVTLDTGEVRRLPWLAGVGPTDVAVMP